MPERFVQLSPFAWSTRLFILFIYLFDFQLRTCKNGTLQLLLSFFEHGINFGWREQVETTSTMPVNHISELKL